VSDIRESAPVIGLNHCDKALWRRACPGENLNLSAGNRGAAAAQSHLTKELYLLAKRHAGLLS
jgi:hypothetical protein